MHHTNVNKRGKDKEGMWEHCTICSIFCKPKTALKIKSVNWGGRGKMLTTKEKTMRLGPDLIYN